ncbi:MAG TPA: elongation factor P [Candidatus Kapabacteria bacterium]|jgi:elongation factor P
MASTNDFRVGAVLKMEGELYQIEEYVHRTPGNLRAFVQAKMRNMKTGNLKEVRFRSGEEVEMIRMEKKPMQFLYRDGSDFVFMDNENYEQMNVPEKTVGTGAKFVKESDNCDILFAEDGTIVAVEPPNFAILQISQTDPGFKGDTATGATKPATLETGAVVNVPLFLNEGDKVRVDTRTGMYLERVKA